MGLSSYLKSRHANSRGLIQRCLELASRQGIPSQKMVASETLHSNFEPPTRSAAGTGHHIAHRVAILSRASRCIRVTGPTDTAAAEVLDYDPCLLDQF
jgi:hypothetical protein